MLLDVFNVLDKVDRSGLLGAADLLPAFALLEVRIGLAREALDDTLCFALLFFILLFVLLIILLRGLLVSPPRPRPRALAVPAPRPLSVAPPRPRTRMNLIE